MNDIELRQAALHLAIRNRGNQLYTGAKEIVKDAAIICDYLKGTSDFQILEAARNLADVVKSNA